MYIEAQAGDTGGNFSYPQPGCDTAVIRIGLKYAAFGGVSEVILHELFEFALTTMRLRYHNDDDLTLGKTSNGALFLFNHDEMSEAVGRVNAAYVDIVRIVRPMWAKAMRERSKR